MTPTEIRERRLAYRFDRDDLATAVGVLYSTVGHWETGRRTPRSRHMRKLEAVLGLRSWFEVDHPLCATCRIVPPSRQATECGGCRMKRWRASKMEATTP